MWFIHTEAGSYASVFGSSGWSQALMVRTCQRYSFKGKHRIGCLKRIWRQLSPKARRLFFISVIQPCLEYGAIVTCTALNQRDRDRLLALHRRGVHVVCGASLTLSRPGGTLCPPHLNHSISSKRLGVWSYGFVNFRFMFFSFRKVQFHQSALIYIAMATMQLSGLFLQTRTTISTWEKFSEG